MRRVRSAPIDVPDHVADWMIQSSDPQLRLWLVEHSNCRPEWVTALLLHDRDAEVRQKAACNPLAPPAVLAEAAGSENDPSVLERIAGNENTPPEALHTVVMRLKGLSRPRDRDLFALSGVAHNPNARPDTLTVLHETYPGVRNVEYGVACNPNTPQKVLRNIYRESARRRSIPTLQAMLSFLARNPSSSSDVVFGCLTHPAADFTVRSHAGKHANLADGLLQEAVDSPDPEVRAAAAANPNLTGGQVETLCNDPQQQVRAVALTRPDVPAAVLLRAAQRRGTDALISIAANRKTPPEALLDLAAHPHGLVRRAALDNPNCPPEGRAAAWLCN